MKKVLFVFLLFSCLNTLAAQGRFTFGGGGTTIYNPFELGVQVKAKFDIYEKTGTAATFSFYLDDVINWGLDVDQHYNNFVTIGDLGFSPFAGVNILNTDPKNHWGLNLGIFSDFELDNGRTLYVEPKYVIGNADRFTLSVGVSF